MEPSGPEQPGQPEQPGHPAAELFDRWLSRTGRAEEPSGPAGGSADGVVPGPPEETAEPPRPAAPPVVAAPVDPLFDDSFVADRAEPTVVEQVVEEVLGVAPPRPAEPVTPPDFEPVLTASARRREQAGADRLRSRPGLPAEAGGGDQAADDGPDDEPSSRPHAEQPTQPAPAGHLDAGRAVLAELAGAPALAPEAAPGATAAEAAGPAEEPPAPPGATPAAVTPAADPARAVVEALDAPTPAAPAPPRPRPDLRPDPRPRQPRRSGRTEAADPPAPRPGPVAPDVARAMLASSFVEPTPPAEPAETTPGIAAGDAGPSAPAPASVPPVVEFAPRTGVRRLTGVLLLACLGATAAAGWAAYAERTELSIALAVTLGVLTLVVWGVRAGTGVTRLVARGGMLEVHRAGARFVFDLTSRHTPVEVVGEPGRRGWKVIFLRRGMAPFAVDSSMVDPHEFTRVLRHYRPR